jgi:hypothetical protein
LRNSHRTTLLRLLALCVVLLSGASAAKHLSLAVANKPFTVQDSYPAPPADRTLVYVADEKDALVALPFETGTTPLRADAVARNDKTSYVEVRGASSRTTLRTNSPRFFLFVADEANSHPPFIVRLSARRNARRVTAISQKGLRGYAIASEEIVKPHYRVLMREGGMLYMEVRLREPLMQGEYAVLGADLKRIATFRIA